MMIYMNAMKQCYLTLRQKFAARYAATDVSLDDFSYFAFHTPFSKMVQKTFMALILADIEVNFAEVTKAGGAKARYDPALMESLASTNFANDAKNSALLLQKFGARWKD